MFNCSCENGLISHLQQEYTKIGAKCQRTQTKHSTCFRGVFTLFPLVRLNCLKNIVLVAVSSRYILRISDYHFSRNLKPSTFCFNAIKTILFQIPRTLVIHCLKYKNQLVCINKDKHVSYYFEICNFKHYASSFYLTLFERLAALRMPTVCVFAFNEESRAISKYDMSEQRGKPVCTCMQAFSFTFWKCLLTCDPDQTGT